MTPQQLHAWRKRLLWSQTEAANALGLSLRAYQDHERGERNGKRRTIPRHIGLACAAIALGIMEYPPA